MSYEYSGRDTTLYYSSPSEIMTRGNFLPEDIRSDWVSPDNEADLDAYLIVILEIVKDIIDRDRNINFSDEAGGVPDTIHLAAELLGYFLIKDSSDTQDSYIKNNEEVRIYTTRKMFDDNVRSVLDLIPKRVVSGKVQNCIRIKAVKSSSPNVTDIIRWR